MLTGGENGSVSSVRVVVEVSLAVNEGSKKQVSGDPGKQCLASLYLYHEMFVISLEYFVWTIIWPL